MERHDATAAMAAKGQKEPGVEIDRRARWVIDAALEVHRTLGAGFAEVVYERALCCELTNRRIPFRRQVPIAVRYKGSVVGRGQIDLVVDDRVVVELKAVESLLPLHGAQVLGYLKATGLCLGLLINFNVPLLRTGPRRIVLNP